MITQMLETYPPSDTCKRKCVIHSCIDRNKHETCTFFLRIFVDIIKTPQVWCIAHSRIQQQRNLAAYDRLRLAGIPTTQQKWSKKFNQGVYIAHNLEGLTIEQAMSQHKIFILDHHDYLMPFLNRINIKGICAYASRTLLFSSKDGSLKPVAIELSLPGSSSSEEDPWVFVPASQGIEAALWQLAKTHVTANDSAHHQLISHW